MGGIFHSWHPTNSVEALTD